MAENKKTIDTRNKAENASMKPRMVDSLENIELNNRMAFGTKDMEKVNNKFEQADLPEDDERIMDKVWDNYDRFIKNTTLVPPLE